MDNDTHNRLSSSRGVGSIELNGNTFGRLVVGTEVDEWLSKSDQVDIIIKSEVRLSDNLFARTDNELLAKSCSVQSNSFAVPGEKPSIGMTCMALKIAAMANLSLSWDATQGLSHFICWKGTLNPKAKIFNDIQLDER